ncbi:hypothetical protein BT63DRAFT_460652 [Microthyrium microscopicum]|uniref:WD40 repeat-like protein n=1 Tax=Microthyrium microscopicum TaxID=703497 RepID=A0A6A6TX99_9PEZI|nr:hypothetical protein BT63DRAFT_460652 [Microthyrium microscopicum]
MFSKPKLLPGPEASIKPVTALLSFEQYLIAGEGFHLVVYNKQNGAIVASGQVFDSDSITGIILLGYAIVAPATDRGILRVLVSGGRSLCPVDIRNDSIYLGPLINSLDRILHLDRKCPTQSPQDTIAVVSVLGGLYKYDPRSSECTGIGHINSPTTISEQTILFGATANFGYRAFDQSNQAQDRLTVAAGTANGDISLKVLERVQGPLIPGMHDNWATIKYTQNRAAHPGSVFSVDFLVERGLAASCGDDRYIKIWDLGVDFRQEQAFTACENPLNGVSDPNSWTCLASTIAHEARIWDIRFLHDREGSGLVRLISYSEDATCRLWVLNEDGNTTSLRQVACFNRHSGKNIWSLTYEPKYGVPAEFAAIYTGGGDGAITSALVSPNTWNEKPEIRTWRFSDNIKVMKEPRKEPNFQPSSARSRNNHCRSLAMINRHQTVAISNDGDVVLLRYADSLRALDRFLVTQNPPDELLGEFVLIGSTSTLKGYSVVTFSFLSGSFTIIAGTHYVYFVDMEKSKLSLLRKIDHKILGLWLCGTVTSPSGDTIVYLGMSLHGHRNFELLKLEYDTSQCLEVTAIYFADISDKFGTSSTGTDVVTSCSSVIHQGILCLVLGFRKGSIRIYSHSSDITPSSYKYISLEEIPNAGIQSIHGKETVTHIQWICDSSSNERLHTVSVGRDGHVAISRISLDGVSSSSLVHRLGVPFGTAIEGFWIPPTGQGLYLYGFKSTKFIVYDVLADQELWNIPCGGARRPYTCHFQKLNPEDVLDFIFVWIEGHELKIAHKIRRTDTIIKSGAHGRDIKASAVSSLENGQCDVIATGAEDTIIKLFTQEQQPGRTAAVDLKCSATLRGHTTGIQNLVWSKDGRYLFSSGGFEELFVWRIQPAPLVGIGVICEAKVPRGMEKELELRISGFDVHWCEPEQAFVITLVYAYRSLIKTFLYRPGEESPWTVISRTTAGNAGLTHISYVNNSASAKLNELCFVTAGSDGVVTLWSPKDLRESTTKLDDAPEHTMLLTSQHLSSSIKCLSVLPLGPMETLIGIVGDGSYIAFARLVKSSSLSHKFMQPFTVAGRTVQPQHCAAITTISLYANPKPPVEHIKQSSSNPEERQEREIFAVTAGPDQQLTVTKISVRSTNSADAVEIQSVRQTTTAVADISSIALFPPQSSGIPKMVVCGAGMETWNLDVYEEGPKAAET